MALHLSTIVLFIGSMALLWLLLAAPLGVRTLHLRRAFPVGSERVWSAVSPTGTYADWHHAVLACRPVPGHHDQIAQTLAQPDRHGVPIVRVLACAETDGEKPDAHECRIRVVDDSALDPLFWASYEERRRVESSEAGCTLTVEQTDRYRGLAFLAFRFFQARREMRALGRWLQTGVSAPDILRFEHPLVQVLLALVSTLILWPFFGLTSFGLTMSVLLTLVIVIHEFGHMLAYRVFGHTSARMIVIPLLGGVAIGGRPYNSLFEVAVCALMGAGMSALLVPLTIGLHWIAADNAMMHRAAPVLLMFMLILGAFNLLNLLPMNRFDGGQVLRQVFRDRASLTAGSFLVTIIILGIGWRIGISAELLVASLAVFVLLSLIGQSGIKPRHKLDEMTDVQRIASGFGLYAALGLHGYSIVYATERLFS